MSSTNVCYLPLLKKNNTEITALIRAAAAPNDSGILAASAPTDNKDNNNM